MKTLSNYFRAINPTAAKFGLLSAFSLGLVGVASIIMPSSISASTLPYNDPSNIVNGGVTSVSSVISHYNSNNPSDIQSIYKAFGWTSATDFQKAVNGTLNSDGTLTVNGKIVADEASAIGRKGPADGYKDTTPKTINGKTYYMTPLSYILGFYKMSSTTSYVQMNGNTPQFVVMTDCGNAVTVRTPQYSCDMLNATKISDFNYQFSANVTAKNGATLSKVVYDFGDGSATVTEANASTVVSHTYDSTKPGTYTAKVTAYFTYHGQTEVVTASSCEKQITIPKPPTPVYECSALTASLIDTQTNTYHFVVTYKAANGAVLKGGNITFGDNAQGTFAPNMLTIDHAYLNPGTYTAVATLTFDVNGQTKTVTSATCQAKITIPKPPVTPVFICSNLTSTLVGTNTYSFTANAQVSNATLVNGSFNFGDGQNSGTLTPAAGNPNQIVSNGHTYPSSPTKTYTIVATLTFSVNGKTQTVTGGNCQTQITVNQPPVECKPGIPVGSPQCQTTPPNLPSTGPQDILGSAFGLSSIVAAGTHYARSRRDLLTALLKRR